MSEVPRFEAQFHATRWVVMDHERMEITPARTRRKALLWAKHLNELVAKGLPVTTALHPNGVPLERT